MNRTVALCLATIILCVQGALLWHFATMDTSAHTACPLPLVARDVCVDMTNVVDVVEHHVSILAGLTSAIPLSDVLVTLFLVAVATVWLLHFEPPKVAARSPVTRTRQMQARFESTRKRIDWLAALRLQGTGLIFPVAA